MAKDSDINSPKELEGVERVEVIKLLKVWLESDMRARRRIEYITYICNQRLYLLNQIRKQGLQQLQLNVFQALYCLATCTHRPHGIVMHLMFTSIAFKRSLGRLKGGILLIATLLL